MRRAQEDCTDHRIHEPGGSFIPRSSLPERKETGYPPSDEHFPAPPRRRGGRPPQRAGVDHSSSHQQEASELVNAASIHRRQPNRAALRILVLDQEMCWACPDEGSMRMDRNITLWNYCTEVTDEDVSALLAVAANRRQTITQTTPTVNQIGSESQPTGLTCPWSPCGHWTGLGNAWRSCRTFCQTSNGWRRSRHLVRDPADLLDRTKRRAAGGREGRCWPPLSTEIIDVQTCSFRPLKTLTGIKDA